MQADIVDIADALAISEGIDAIVHLGGYAAEGPWETILKANIIGCGAISRDMVEAKKAAVAL